MMESVSNMLNCMINAHVLFVMSKTGQIDECGYPSWIGCSGLAG